MPNSNKLYSINTTTNHIVYLPIKDRINSPILYIGRVHFRFQVCQAILPGYVDIWKKKMVELFANSGNPNQTSATSDLGLHCLSVTRSGVSSLQWVKQQIELLVSLTEI